MMDTQERMLQERLVRMQIDDQRMNREIKHLTKLQKKTFLEINKGKKQFEVVSSDSSTGIILLSLQDLGLIQISQVKGEMRVICITTKGKLLLLENPKLHFHLQEFGRWLVTTIIAGLALIISVFLLLK